MTHEELLLRMSAREFAFWIALYRIEDRERRRNQQKAEDQTKAMQMSRSMRR